MGRAKKKAEKRQAWLLEQLKAKLDLTNTRAFTSIFRVARLCFAKINSGLEGPVAVFEFLVELGSAVANKLIFCAWHVWQGCPPALKFPITSDIKPKL